MQSKVEGDQIPLDCELSLGDEPAVEACDADRGVSGATIADIPRPVLDGSGAAGVEDLPARRGLLLGGNGPKCRKNNSKSAPDPADVTNRYGVPCHA